MTGREATRVRVGNTDHAATVVLSRHAAERYVERVAPALTAGAAVGAIKNLSGLSAITACAPEWHSTRKPAQMYLTLGDVSFALAVDRTDPEQLVATTCVTRDTSRTCPAPARDRLLARAQRRGRSPYYRPSPNRLAYFPDREDS